MKSLRIFAVLASLLAVTPALAQQVQNHAVPLGRGAGNTGFGAAVPSTAGRPLISNGAGVDPSFGTIANSGLTAGPADTAKGSLNGTTVADLPLPPCTAVNQAWRYTAGVGINCASVSVTTGFEAPINLGLSASAAAGALTINVTQASGAAPSASGPVLVPFRSTTSTTGTVTWNTISAALSLVIPSGASLGTSSGSVPFRVWIFLDANAGTPAIGVATCSTSTTLFPCASWEHTLKTSITISAGATSAGTLYATAGVALDAVRIIGFCDFASGLVTAGTWASACTTLQVFGPGIKKPGEVVQSIFNSTGAVATGTTVMPTDDTIPQNTEGNQYMTQAITPASPANILEVDILGNFATTANAVGFTVALFQDATAGALAAGNFQNPGGNALFQVLIKWTLTATVAGSTTFNVRAGSTSAGTTTFNGAIGARLLGGSLKSYIRIQEIMGFDVQKPANDNVHPGVLSATG